MFIDKLTFSLYVMVIGLVVVFVVLIVLVGFSKLTGFVNLIPSREEMKRKRREKMEAEKTADAPAPAVPAAAPAPAPAVSGSPDEDELQAVIAAAIAAYLAEAPGAAACPNGIVVRSVRRTGSFNAASRYERMNNRI